MDYKKAVATLKAKRHALGLSARVVDQDLLLGSGNDVGKYECFERRPSFPRFIAWAEALGFEVRLVEKSPTPLNKEEPNAAMHD